MPQCPVCTTAISSEPRAEIRAGRVVLVFGLFVHTRCANVPNALERTVGYHGVHLSVEDAQEFVRATIVEEPHAELVAGVSAIESYDEPVAISRPIGGTTTVAMKSGMIWELRPVPGTTAHAPVMDWVQGFIALPGTRAAMENPDASAPRD